VSQQFYNSFLLFLYLFKMPGLQSLFFEGGISYRMKGEATDSAYETLAAAEPAFTF